MEKAKRKKMPSQSQATDELPHTQNAHLIKALILKGLQSFEDSFRRQHPEASLETLRDHMTQYLSERTRFECEHPRRSFRYGRCN